MKNIIILGSTGTIGLQALDVINSYPAEFKLLGISGFENVPLLTKQIKTFKPEFVAIPDPKKAEKLKDINPGTVILSGKQALQDLVSLKEADIICVSIAGIAALIPTLHAIKLGKTIALASKEVLVSAGHLVSSDLKKFKTNLYPIDSEHAAIDMCMQNYPRDTISKIILTASGGPFLHRKNLSGIKPEDALKHPNWNMGRKITIDSATLINKGLEVIEAHWLFGFGYEQIKVLVHPQSIIHGMVLLKNQAYLAQMSSTDMRIPILYALSARKITNFNHHPLDLANLKLEFMEPDLKKFKGLHLAYEVGKKGHSWPAVFNSANEEAVTLFLQNKIKFTAIYSCIEKTLEKHNEIKNPAIDDILNLDSWARNTVLAVALS
ncbi:MAG: 1-deoxy-D-xylulose-5-phosphate reductoisomerase [Candidatus Margulisbacteria bacterium]|nr:1-deoxy-D-xylulose-5-phosphate reductoisomerase [Candidatus Margulisiibacteriota bacterium]